MGWGPGPTARLFGLFFKAKLCPFFLRILACRGSFFFSLQVWWRDGSGRWTEGTGLRVLDWGHWAEDTEQFFFLPAGMGQDGSGHWTEGTGLRALNWGYWTEGTGLRQDGSGRWTEGTGLRALGWGYWTEGTGLRQDGSGHWTEGTGLRALDWGHWAEGTGLMVLGWGYWTEGTKLRKLDYGYYGLRELTTEWLWWSTWIEGLELNYKKKRLTMDWGTWPLKTKWLNCSTWIEGPELHELRDLNWLIDLRALTILSDWSEIYTWTRTRLRRLTMDWGTWPLRTEKTGLLSDWTVVPVGLRSLAFNEQECSIFLVII